MKRILLSLIKKLSSLGFHRLVEFLLIIINSFLLLKFHLINFLGKIHPFLYNHIYGRPKHFLMLYTKHYILLFKLRNWSKPTKRYIIRKFYGMQRAKINRQRKELYQHNMRIIAKTSDELNIPQYILIEQLKRR